MTTLKRSIGLIKKVFILGDRMAKHVQVWQNTRAINKKDKVYAQAGQ